MGYLVKKYNVLKMRPNHIIREYGDKLYSILMYSKTDRAKLKISSKKYLIKKKS